MYHSQKTLGWKIDYFKLKKYFASKYNLNFINFYTSFVKEDFRQQQRFTNLRNCGYTIRSKLLKFIKDQSGQIIKKGNLDIELALDAYRLKSNYETIILFSGDSDFAYLLKLLKQFNKNMVIVSTRGHISKELLVNTDVYIDLKKLFNIISI